MALKFYESLNLGKKFYMRSCLIYKDNNWVSQCHKFNFLKIEFNWNNSILWQQTTNSSSLENNPPCDESTGNKITAHSLMANKYVLTFSKMQASGRKRFRCFHSIFSRLQSALKEENETWMTPTHVGLLFVAIIRNVKHCQELLVMRYLSWVYWFFLRRCE